MYMINVHVQNAKNGASSRILVAPTDKLVQAFIRRRWPKNTNTVALEVASTTVAMPTMVKPCSIRSFTTSKSIVTTVAPVVLAVTAMV